MSIKKKSSEQVPLTRDLAIKFSTMTALPGEREKKPARLKWIRELIRDKMFGDPTWDVAVIRGTDQELRVNGQHTSTVLATIPEEQFPTGLDVTIIRWAIDDTPEDRAELFDRMDSLRGLLR
jgi:hypothetical protein